jgi:hypothetical protein
MAREGVPYLRKVKEKIKEHIMNNLKILRAINDSFTVHAKDISVTGIH